MFNLTHQLNVPIIDKIFPNCMENSIINFIRLLHYDIEKQKYNLTNNTQINIILNDTPDENDLMEVSRYLNLLNVDNIQHVNIDNIDIFKYELETSLLNFIVILNYLLDLELNIDKDSIKILKNEFIEKINSLYPQYEFDIKMYIAKDDGEYTYMEIKNKIKNDMSYSITLQKYIHAEMNLLEF
jgi:hypothetical protein